MITLFNDPAKYASQQEYYAAWNNAGRVLGRWDSGDPVSFTTVVGESTLKYPITLPNGQKRQVTATSPQDASVTHILSGLDFTQSNNTVDRGYPEGVNGTLQNLWRQYIRKLKPLTVEEISDSRIEALLKKHNVPYEKFSFDTFGVPATAE